MSCLNLIEGNHVDFDESVDAYERKKDQLLALANEQLVPVRVDVRNAAIAALKVVDACGDPDIGRRLEASFPGRVWDAAVGALRDSALAAYQAGQRMNDAEIKQDSRRVPEKMVAQAKDLRKRMLRVIAHNLGETAEAAPEIRAVVGGNSYIDLTSDLKRLASLYERFAAELEHDRWYSVDDRGAARAIARDLLTELGQFEDAYGRAVDMQARAFTLLSKSYSELRTALLYACRDLRGVEEQFGSLITASRRRPSLSRD